LVAADIAFHHAKDRRVVLTGNAIGITTLTVGAVVAADIAFEHATVIAGDVDAIIAIIIAFLALRAELQALVAIELAGIRVRIGRLDALLTHRVANQTRGAVEHADIALQ
jgi:hypothetical protein